MKRIPCCRSVGHTNPELFARHMTHVVWHDSLAMVVQDWSSSGRRAESMWEIIGCNYKFIMHFNQHQVFEVLGRKLTRAMMSPQVVVDLSCGSLAAALILRCA